MPATNKPQSRRKKRRAIAKPLLVGICAGVLAVALLLALAALCSRRRTGNAPAAEDAAMLEARRLYGRSLELMSQRQFDAAAPLVQEARQLHLALIERAVPADWLEAQERHLGLYERLLSERAAASDLEPLRQASQQRMRKASLQNALERAHTLAAEGRRDEAVRLLEEFAAQHADTEEARQALAAAAQLPP